MSWVHIVGILFGIAVSFLTLAGCFKRHRERKTQEQNREAYFDTMRDKP
jgi:hypothetical protein